MATNNNHQAPESQTSGAAPIDGLNPCGATAKPGCRCKDASERSRAELESELAALRKRTNSLIQQASMAEVASTALHNVGNVLNSVNVSASVVAQRLRQCRINNLGKALGLLREHQENLGPFLKDDPKGKMLPAYLEALADHLQTEHNGLLQEMEALKRSLEHMKEIVAVQQNYAGKCGVLETLPPAELLEDALRMNWAAFERHNVSIVRQFAETPPVTVDKHKVLQILVNLIRNAKYAMEERACERKVLRLEIASKSADTLAIKVQDNGIGIAPENLDKIFNHGFTTKRDGHGFGLHSGVMAAAEMGGKLTAESEGVGKGATFCLELPFAKGPINHNDHASGSITDFA